MINEGKNYKVKKIKNMGLMNYYKKVVPDLEKTPKSIEKSVFKKRLKMQAPGNDPTGLIFMDGFLYLADALIGKIFKIDIQNGAVIGEIKAPVEHPWGMCMDNNSIWITDDVNRKIINISKTFDRIYKGFYYGKLKGRVDLDLHGLSYSNGSLWVSDFMGNRLLKIDPFSGRIIGEIPVIIPDLSGLLIDGDFYWVASSMLSYIFQIDLSGNVHKIVKMMDGNYNHIHALTRINEKEIAFSSRNKLIISIGEIQ